MNTRTCDVLTGARKSWLVSLTLVRKNKKPAALRFVATPLLSVFRMAGFLRTYDEPVVANVLLACTNDVADKVVAAGAADTGRSFLKAVQSLRPLSVLSCLAASLSFHYDI